MQYVTDLSKYQTENRTAVTLGKFDGLHRGHQELISRIQRFADQEKAESVVFAFDMGKEALMTGEEKKAYLEGCVDTLIICPFTEAIREMEAEEFIEKILIEQLHAAYIAVGTDFHFGHQKRGDICMLKQYAKRYGYELEIVEKAVYRKREISSTYIREELKKGNMEKVTSLMGRDYFVEGQVVHGRGMGHKVLLPTTNLVPPRTKILPPNGVYVTSSYFGDKIYHGITNIGCKPTVGESFIGVETYLFDCKEDLYGEECRVDFKKFLRPERKFPSLEALKSRLLADAEDGRRFFEKTEK